MQFARVNGSLEFLAILAGTLTVVFILSEIFNIYLDNPNATQKISFSNDEQVKAELPAVLSEQSSETITVSNPVALSDFKYPKAIVLSTEANAMVLESSDRPEEITNWYKQMVESLNLNINTFVQTSANGKVVNLLDSADNSREIKIEIRSDSKNASTTIIVAVQYY